MKKISFTIVFVLSHVFLFSQCLPDGITFTTQIQIDNFQTDYPGCTEIEGDVEINGNDIINLNGIIVLTSIDGFCKIIHCASLNSLTGLENLSTVGGDFAIGTNATLVDLTGLDNLTSIGEDLLIYENSDLTSLDGLESLDSITGDLGLGSFVHSGNPSLTNILGLESLLSIGGNLFIRSNNLLNGLSGLDNLTSVGGLVYIRGNNTLTNLSGLDNLTLIEGEFEVHNNDSLNSLAGIDNIEAGSISNLRIYDNQLLSTCEVRSVCDYLATPNGITEIHDNATGCDSEAEVEIACETVSIDVHSLQNNLSNYPNPFSTATTISYTLQQPATVHISIYNQLGRQVDMIKQRQSQGKQWIVWTPENLSAGIYYFRLQAGEQTATGKLMLLP